MEQEYLSKILGAFAESRMNTLYSEDKYNQAQRQFTKHYEKKIKRLIANEKYFGTHIRLANGMRRVAVLAVTVISLIAANTVSAKVFGFNPWEMIKKSLGDMYEIRYEKPKKETPPIEIGERIHDIPAYVPDGFARIQYEKEENVGILAEWKRGEQDIGYMGVLIQEDMRTSIDAEYENEKHVTIAGYDAVLMKEGTELYLLWNDKQYQNNLDGNEISEEELIKIAESLYKNEK